MHHFPPYISPSKRAFEKYIPWGLFSEFYGIGVESRKQTDNQSQYFSIRCERFNFFLPLFGSNIYKIIITWTFLWAQILCILNGAGVPKIEVSQRRVSTVDCTCKKSERGIGEIRILFSPYNTVLCHNALDASDYDSNSDSITCESQLHMVVLCT